MHVTGEKLIINNKDRNGQTLRPSNWAERLACVAGDFDKGRIVYDGKVQPCIACKGKVCLVVDTAIAQTKPWMMDTIDSFMKVNDLAPYAGACPKYRTAAQEEAAPRKSNVVFLAA